MLDLSSCKGAKEEAAGKQSYLHTQKDIRMPTLTHISQLSSIPGLEDVTVEVSPLSVTTVTNGSHSETTSEQPQVKRLSHRDVGSLG